MKKLGLSGLAALLMLTFGITFLNFEELSLEANYKVYALLLFGVILLSYTLFTKRNS